MTDVATASTALRNREAGEDLARSISSQLNGESPDALVVFTSPQNDYQALLSALSDHFRGVPLVGCSSAGEFTGDASGTGLASAIALRSSEMQFSVSLATSLSKNRAQAATDLVSRFKGMKGADYRYRTALVLIDALAGHSDDLIDRLTMATGGMYRFFGGGAGDDARFTKTHVFLGAEAYSDAAVALEILSNKPIGIGARHGWSPASHPMRVTESADSNLMSLNVAPAIEAFEEYATNTNQALERSNPLPFFLHNIVGVKTDGGYKLRVPLGVSDSGGILCASDVPEGSTAHIMSTGATDAATAAASATRDAMDQVRDAGYVPKAALFFDCVATRLRLGQSFDDELSAVSNELGDAPFVGFNSYGQIVRSEGQFSGFHNCTAVVCVFPD